MGIPVGLYFANRVGWHAPFVIITIVSIIEFITIAVNMRPINAHLIMKSDRSPFQHLFKTVTQPNYLLAFLFSTLLVTDGYMFMPFGSAFSVNNLGISMGQLSLLYFITGIFSMAAGPLIGNLSDKIGKFRVFGLGSILALVIILYYCNLGVTPFWLVVALNTALMMGVLSRMISSSALITAIPEPNERGAFMSVNSSVQQLSGGIASVFAGLIVVQSDNGALKHYDTIGYIVVATIILTIVILRSIDRYVSKKTQTAKLSYAMHDNNIAVPAEIQVESNI
jgi:predicted MFS family arabinose efflux permease